MRIGDLFKPKQVHDDLAGLDAAGLDVFDEARQVAVKHSGIQNNRAHWERGQAFWPVQL